MRDDVRPQLKWVAQIRRCQGVIDNKREIVFFRQCRELGEIQNPQSRIPNGFRKNQFRIGAECFLNLFFGGFRIDESGLNTITSQGAIQQRISASINRRSRHQMIPGTGNIGNR